MVGYSFTGKSLIAIAPAKMTIIEMTIENTGLSMKNLENIYRLVSMIFSTFTGIPGLTLKRLLTITRSPSFKPFSTM